ncbi:MAG: serine/threonine-protein kinase [Burkholderiales bacterium]|nr:serine/threonine-protein kinase [Burkholderiales bacterium]
MDHKAPLHRRAGDAFDAAFWRTANELLDQLLDASGDVRAQLLARLEREQPSLHRTVSTLLQRVENPAAGLPLGTQNRGISFNALLEEALAEPDPRPVYRPRPEDRCGPWRLIERLGHGGMSEVWLAERVDGLFSARVAVKFLRTDGDASRFLARFARERELLARLNHPAIARMLDAGFKEGTPYLVLEYVEGKPLLNYVAAHAPRLRERMELIRQLGEALIHAHSQLVVHRDIKPSNVLVTAEGRVKLLDFGVAGLLDASDPQSTTESPATRIAGRGLTVEYAAPEQIRGTASGVASDIYSVAALAYHLCTGRRAHLCEPGNRVALEHAILHTEPVRASLAARTTPPFPASDLIAPPLDADAIKGDIDAILAQGMRRDPRARYTTMSEFVGDIDRWLRHLPISARREDRRYRIRKWLRRNWLAATLTAGLLLALSLGLAVSLWQAERARAEAARASKTSAFLIEMLNGADPDVHGGQWPSVLALIERARAEVPVRFRDDPQVELQVSFHLATVLRRLSRFADALPLARRSVELATERLGSRAQLARQSRVLLADILYWNDETREALSLLDGALAAGPPEPNERWWQEAILLRANMLGELRRFDESYAEFDRYLALIGDAPERLWQRIEADIDRALIRGREGRIEEAYRLHLKYRSQLDAPPQHARRTALNALMSLAHFQIRLGIPDGIEEILHRVIDGWDQLAGRRNRHSLEALDELGLFHLRFGDAQKALAAYRERAVRIEAGAAVQTGAALQIPLDVLEVEFKRGLRAPRDLLPQLSVLEARISRELPPETSLRNALLARLIPLALAAGEVATAQRIWQTLPPLVPESAEPRSVAARIALGAELQMVQGDWIGGCQSALRLLETARPFNEGHEGAIRHLRAALYCTLARAPEAERLRLEAARRLPATLPADHRLRRILAYVERAAQMNTEPDRLRRIAAESLALPITSVAHPALPGLWL